MTSLNRKLLRDLLHLRGQVIAVALVIACGIATYVTMRSTYESLRISQATYYENFRFADLFVQLKRAPNGLAERIRAIPGVALAQTRIVVEVTLDVPGLDEPAMGRLISIPERPTRMLNDLYIRNGRYIEPGRQDEVIVSEAFAVANKLNLGDTLGAVINQRWKQLRIVGIALSPEYIYEVPGGAIFPDNKRFGVLWMSRDALGPAFDMEGAFNDVVISLAPGAIEADVIAQLDLLLERYGCLGAYGREDQTSHRFISDEIAQNKAQGTFIPPIFLGVAAFLLHIVLSRLVSTQRDQIAILKAFGYGNLTVGLHYLKFALVAVLGGVALGAVAGLWFGSKLTQVYMLFYRFPILRYEAGPELVGFAMLISVCSAGLGALGAMKQAVSLPPAEAMRPEPPANFRPLLIDRLGFHSLLSPVVRMIARNIERRPMKALFSALGVALAVAILVIGGYSFDAINYIIEFQFRNVQREDVTVVFNNPRPARTRHDLANLPGVIRSEPYRAVPVRLRFGHRMRRTLLLGLEPMGELRRLVSKELQVVNLPSDGLVLTTKLAEILGVAEGDTLKVEALEGARPVRQVVVVRLVDELIGVSAYMDVRALNRLMREGETISGSYLSVDPLLAQRLYSLLKRMPAVSGVSVREAALASFEETIAKSLGIFTTVIVLFACIIAFGMVYNGARIALSERGHELASLRVLGFTQGEVAIMLLGEQAILTSIAIPIGFMLGFAVSALISLRLQTELFRMPLVVSGETYAFAFIVVAVAAFLTGLLVRRRLYHLDLVAVLKTRE